MGINGVQVGSLTRIGARKWSHSERDCFQTRTIRADGSVVTGLGRWIKQIAKTAPQSQTRSLNEGCMSGRSKWRT